MAAPIPEEIDERPKVVALIGSPHWRRAFRDAELNETLAGNIVLWFNRDVYADHRLFTGKDWMDASAINAKLLELQYRRIDLADEVLVLNPGGFVTPEVLDEARYAKAQGKVVRWLERTRDGELSLEG